MKTLVATGVSSGLGLRTLQLSIHSHLSRSSPPPLQILAGTRSSSLSPAQLELTHSTDGTAVDLAWLSLNLESLDSVRNFAREVEKRTKNVDCLWLNAAVWTANGEARTVELKNGEQWAEEAVVNHFAQHYLTLLLTPLLQASARRAKEEGGTPPRVVHTTSALHSSIASVDDPLPLLRLFSSQSSSPSPHRTSSPKLRYAASKFCTLLSLTSLSNTPSFSAPEAPIDIVAVSPGFVPSTGLGREAGLVAGWVMRNVVGRMPFAVTEEEGAKRLLRALPTLCPSSAPHYSEAEQDPTALDRLLSAHCTSSSSSPPPILFLSGSSTAPLAENAQGDIGRALLNALPLLPPPAGEGGKETEEEREERERRGKKWEEVRRMWAPGKEEMDGW
ncbi:hypothetical protein JCM8547_008917 [Rhodosporidiobolus lusitaniae]